MNGLIFSDEYGRKFMDEKLNFDGIKFICVFTIAKRTF
jgi:hypothetical protein